MNNKKKKLIFDIVIILGMTAMLLLVAHFQLFKLYAEFGLIPLLIFYHLGALSVTKRGIGYDFSESDKQKQ